MAAFVIQPDGTRVPLGVSKPPSLEEAQKAVGGYVELVHGVLPEAFDEPAHEVQFLCDEEGKIKSPMADANPMATRMAKRAGAIALLDVLIGPVLVLSGEHMWRDDEEAGDD